MQGQRSIFDPYPETVDLNLRSNSNMDESDDWNMLSPMERRLLNNDLSSEINFSCVNNTNNNHNHHNFRSFSSWDIGESSSSSRASLQDHVSNDSHVTITPSNTLNVQRSVSNHIPMNVNLNIGYDGNSDDEDDNDDDMGFMDFYKSGRPEPQASGLSYKRKSLEGTSAQPPLSFFPQASRSLNILPPLFNPVPVIHHESPNARVSENAHIGLRGTVPYNNISTGNNPTRYPNINPSNSHSHQSSNRQILLNEFLDQTSGGPPIVPPGNSSNFLNQQPPLMHVPSMPRNGPHFPWGNNIGSSSLLRNNNNLQYHNFDPPSDSRNLNLVQDPTNWSLATGNSSVASSSSRNGTRPFNTLWSPQHNPIMPSQPYEFPPWSLFPPSAEVESGQQRGHFHSFPTSEDNRVSAGVPSQRHHFQPFSRNGLLMEVPSDDWRALATDIERRQRLVSEIRHVLHAMRRGENLRAEDHMIFDPFINGVAELNDRHRDMRLDVDNMSYEELLALEERIGNVNTGLSEEVILKSMKQRKHIAFMAIPTKNSEPCCICQENYNNGDYIGRLDCGHDFHTDCIKEWLIQKNICPICKMPGLAT